MATATVKDFAYDAEEARRRALLEESDSLLDDVEKLRLEDETEAPQQLREAIRALQVRLGRSDPPLPPAALHAAHDLVFAVQQRLMAANPKHPRPNRHVGRPGGQPVMTVVRENQLWKLLTLPPPPSSTPDDSWLELVDATVERAWHRWSYAHQHARRAATERYRADLALAVARTAWSNYWELSQEAVRIRAQMQARGAPRGGGGPSPPA